MLVCGPSSAPGPPKASELQPLISSGWDCGTEGWDYLQGDKHEMNGEWSQLVQVYEQAAIIHHSQDHEAHLNELELEQNSK